jgi:hypothetical protein
MLGALRINFLGIAQCGQHFHTLAVCTSQKCWKTSLCATSFSHTCWWDFARIFWKAPYSEACGGYAISTTKKKCKDTNKHQIANKNVTILGVY